MNGNRDVDMEDNETCAPEIICERSFDENDISLYDPDLGNTENCVLERDPNRRFVYNKSEKNGTWSLNETPDLKSTGKTERGPGPRRFTENLNIFKSHECEGFVKFTSREEAKEKDMKICGMLCTSCRNSEHLARDCPKDPNTRSGANPLEELERISKLKTPKVTMKNMGINRKYHSDKEGFKDIAALIATIKAKNVLQISQHLSTFPNITTEEAENLTLKPKN